MSEVPNNDQSLAKIQATKPPTIQIQSLTSNLIEVNKTLTSKEKTIETNQETNVNPDGFFADLNSSQAAVSVRVALRVRPLLPRELYENSKICVEVNMIDNAVSLGKDRCYTFDKAFDLNQSQQSVFDSCVKNLVLGCFAGFNATVLAYGQTGSGKTFTMGSGFTLGVSEEDLGIIPRVIRLIFQEEAKRKHQSEFLIKCSFLEIYNEELIDLLDQNLVEKMIPQKKEINIREEKNGSISVTGLNEVTVKSSEEMANCLDMGSHARRTASTLMNQASSRSHGIFTITIEQRMIEIPGTDQTESKADEFTVAKFHFVDLAGSERAKKTGATGSILKEGININKSLLALGNVISALTDEQKRSQHIPYRDSKLTRILQDSLGGNSRTSMIACCSPAESSFEETLNTLKYASRARNIKNKPMINRDPASQLIIDLRDQVLELQKECLSQRKVLIQNGIQFQQTVDIPEGIENQQLTKREPKQRNQNEEPVLEAMIQDLRNQLQQKEHQITMLQSKCSQLKLNSDRLEINHLDNLKQRDEARLLAEQLTQRLSELGHPVFIIGNNTSVLDEYRLQNITLEMEVQNLRQQLQLLQIDNQQLIESAQRDTQTLENKQIEIEKLKRSNQQWQAEIDRISKELHPKQQVYSEVTENKDDQFQDNKGSSNKNTLNMKSGKRDTQWLSSDLDHKIKHFDQIRQLFIENLGQQVSNIMTAGSQSSTRNEVIDTQTSQQSNSMNQALYKSNRRDSPSLALDELSSSSDEDNTQEFLQSIESKNDDLITINQNDINISPTKEMQLAEQRNQINSIDCILQDKETLLKNFKESQIELQDSLLQAMKEEYHSKIDQLNQELIRLEFQKSVEMKKQPVGAQRTRIEDQFKNKQEALQSQILQMAKKDRDTKGMQKALEEQQKKIKMLETDLNKLKTQRVIMLKKVKDEQDQLTKFKQERAKEFARLKQNLLKKEKENSELKREANKKDIFVRRKQEELLAVQQRQKLDIQKRQSAKDMKLQLKLVDLQQIRNWIIDNVLRMVEYHELQNELTQKDQEFKQIDAEINLLQTQYAKVQVALEKIEFKMDDHMFQNILSSENVDLAESNQIQHNKQQLEDIREQIEILESKHQFINNQTIDLIRQIEEVRPDAIDSKVMENVQSLEGARACITIFFQLLLEAKLLTNEIQMNCDFKITEIQNLSLQLEQHKQLIEAKNKYHQHTLQEQKLAFEQREKLWFDVVVEKTGVDASGISDGDLNKLFQICFAKPSQSEFQYSSDALKRAAASKLELKKTKTEEVNQTKFSLARQISELEKRLAFSESHNQKLQLEQQQALRDKLKIQKKLDDEKAKSKKQTMLNSKEEIQQEASAQKQQNSIIEMNNNISPFVDRQSINLTQSQKTKTKTISLISVTQPSLKDIRNARKLKKVEETPDIISADQQHQLIQLATVDDVFNRLQQNNSLKKNSPKKSVRHLSRPNSRPGSQMEFTFEEVEQETNKWQIMNDKLDAHKTQVYSLANLDHTLYSGSNKSLKMWDIDTMKAVTEIVDVSIVKSIQISKQRKLLIGASGKDIIVWDLVGLQKIAEYKGANEIKCLQIVRGDMLFAGTKGSANNGALLIFDLRKSVMQPIDEKEKNQDIFSMVSNDENVFMGCRNHQVLPFSINQWQILNPLSPPHFDAVTALSFLGPTLVSGSKDKNLRTYNDSFEMEASVNNAHSDHINCLESDFNQLQGGNLYSGSRDGIIRIWRQDINLDGELKCLAKLDGNATLSSVNALCKLDNKYGTAFVSANFDRSIRIWQQIKPEEIGNRNEQSELEQQPILTTQGSAVSQLRIHHAKRTVKSFKQ